MTFVIHKLLSLLREKRDFINQFKRISDSTSLTTSWFRHLNKAVWSQIEPYPERVRSYTDLLWKSEISPWPLLGHGMFFFPLTGTSGQDNWYALQVEAQSKRCPRRFKHKFGSATGYLCWTGMVLDPRSWRQWPFGLLSWVHCSPCISTVVRVVGLMSLCKLCKNALNPPVLDPSKQKLWMEKR